MQVITFPITLEESFMATPKVKHFVFNCEQNPAFTYLPGQFITVHFEHDNKALKRSYSIANAPGTTNRIEFAAGYFEGGPGTELLYNLKPGEQIHISGPYGRLILKDQVPARYIFVATSTGITPFRSMLGELSVLLQQYPNTKILILQGVQRREEILYHEEFMNFTKNHPQASFRPYLSRMKADELTENEYSGYVQHAFPDINLNSEQDVVYLCGNPGMIDEAFDYLKNQGFSTQEVVREKYISR